MTRTMVLFLAAALASSGCTPAQRHGQSSSYVIVGEVLASSGARPDQFAGHLASDVLTYVRKAADGKEMLTPTVFQDPGRATLHLALKDPGTAEQPATPSPANAVTFTRYQVKYLRTDGRNIPGVDVPYPIDGGLTVSVIGGGASIGQFVLVRAQAKNEPPLRALVGGRGAIQIATVAEVTFYGADQSGRAVTAAGRISVDFADWGDPD